MKPNRLTLRSLLLPVLLSLVFSNVQAQTAEEKGLAIAKERKARDRGWGDTQADMSMILRTAHGQETERKMRVKSLEVMEDGDKGLTIFDQPRDVKGTAFLNFSHPLEPDDQWMYLPALKRVKRIASRNKSGPFMGSEFAFEDMSSFEVEKYRYRYLRDETLDGQTMFVVEHVPVDKYSGYSKMVAWVDQAHYRPFKIEYYDRKGDLLKVLTMYDYRQYLDKYWRPQRAEMYNEQTGKSTEMITHNMTFRTGLSDSDFDKNSLKRAR
ncbi:outer membrane lipoprotein-sorting protein [Aestuariibacter halophilus]|uniref:Outer membrane lipoprotein-sorting protein n=1 Tax=Fluctibacter halophilus TaxID=226011 RepID=A0ABS8G274_9ALTE|nr:outer membrane lipoprotein-sorting protein [Aestuariibacter halophilus]MCC2614682.1 outer membrane lipoprotein-sorting protein [Aestuariibacter halophilus]